MASSVRWPRRPKSSPPDGHRSSLPLMSRALLVERLRQLEEQGIVEKRTRADGLGHEYWLTPAGESAREIVRALGHWGLAHTRDRISADVSIRRSLCGPCASARTWQRCRTIASSSASNSPACPRTGPGCASCGSSSTRSGVDVCAKDPGFPVDITLRGDVVVFVRIYLGHATWDEVMGKAVAIEGNARMAQRIPEWIQLCGSGRSQSQRTTIGTGGRLSKAGRGKGCTTRQRATASIKLSHVMLERLRGARRFSSI
jgi:hypothetical protein